MANRIPRCLDSALAVLTDAELRELTAFLLERRNVAVRRIMAKRDRRPSWKNRISQRRFA